MQLKAPRFRDAAKVDVRWGSDGPEDRKQLLVSPPERNVARPGNLKPSVWAPFLDLKESDMDAGRRRPAAGVGHPKVVVTYGFRRAIRVHCHGGFATRAD